MIRWITSCIGICLLSGCVLGGFTVRGDFAPQHPGATEPVAHATTFVLPATSGSPALYHRFLRTAPERYAWEVFADAPDDPVLVVLRAAFIPLGGGWHAMYWSSPDPGRSKQGYSLVRFQDGKMEVARPMSQLERVMQLASVAELSPTRTRSEDIDIGPASEIKLLAFLRSAAAVPGLAMEALQPAQRVPKKLEQAAYRTITSQVGPEASKDAAKDVQFNREAAAYLKLLDEQGVTGAREALARLAPAADSKDRQGQGCVQDWCRAALAATDQHIERSQARKAELESDIARLGDAQKRQDDRIAELQRRRREAIVTARQKLAGTTDLYLYGERQELVRLTTKALGELDRLAATRGLDASEQSMRERYRTVAVKATLNKSTHWQLVAL